MSHDWKHPFEHEHSEKEKEKMTTGQSPDKDNIKPAPGKGDDKGKGKGDKKVKTLAMGELNVVRRGTNVVAQVQWSDSSGNPAKVDGETSWASTDINVLNVTVNPDDTTQATLTTTGNVGVCQVQASADSDMGQGTVTVTAVADVIVISGEATGGTITISTQ